jgi:hypothetical protein
MGSVRFRAILKVARFRFCEMPQRVHSASYLEIPLPREALKG